MSRWQTFVGPGARVMLSGVPEVRMAPGGERRSGLKVSAAGLGGLSLPVETRRLAVGSVLVSASSRRLSDQGRSGRPKRRLLSARYRVVLDFALFGWSTPRDRDGEWDDGAGLVSRAGGRGGPGGGGDSSRR